MFIDGLVQKNTKFHIISQARIDFVNNEIEVQISHFKTNEHLDLTNADFISCYLINAHNLSDIDNLIMQCWIALANTENSIFANSSLEEINNG